MCHYFVKAELELNVSSIVWKSLSILSNLSVPDDLEGEELCPVLPLSLQQPDHGPCLPLYMTNYSYLCLMTFLLLEPVNLMKNTAYF